MESKRQLGKRLLGSIRRTDIFSILYVSRRKKNDTNLYETIRKIKKKREIE